MTPRTDLLIVLDVIQSRSYRVDALVKMLRVKGNECFVELIAAQFPK